jgi:hypothetical protein
MNLAAIISGEWASSRDIVNRGEPHFRFGEEELHRLARLVRHKDALQRAIMVEGGLEVACMVHDGTAHFCGTLVRARFHVEAAMDIGEEPLR